MGVDFWGDFDKIFAPSPRIEWSELSRRSRALVWLPVQPEMRSEKRLIAEKAHVARRKIKEIFVSRFEWSAGIHGNFPGAKIDAIFNNCRRIEPKIALRPNGESRKPTRKSMLLELSGFRVRVQKLRKFPRKNAFRIPETSAHQIDHSPFISSTRTYRGAWLVIFTLFPAVLTAHNRKFLIFLWVLFNWVGSSITQVTLTSAPAWSKWFVGYVALGRLFWFCKVGWRRIGFRLTKMVKELIMSQEIVWF